MSSVRSVCGDTFKPISNGLHDTVPVTSGVFDAFYQFKVRLNRAKKRRLFTINVPQVIFFFLVQTQTLIILAVVSEFKKKIPTEVFSLHTGVHFAAKNDTPLGFVFAHY